MLKTKEISRDIFKNMFVNALLPRSGRTLGLGIYFNSWKHEK